MKRVKILVATSCVALALVISFAFNAKRATPAYFDKGSGCVLAISDVSVVPVSNHIKSTSGTPAAELNGNVLYKDNGCTAGQEFFEKP